MLRGLKTHRAAGPHNMHPAIVRPLADVVVPRLTNSFNLFLTARKSPESWRMAEVTPIHKGRNKDDKSSYRSVPLLPVMLKVMERCIRDVISRHLIRNELLFQNRCGFLSGKLCLESRLSFPDDVTRRMDGEIQSKSVTWIFDSVIHRLLPSKLRSLNAASSIKTINETANSISQ